MHSWQMHARTLGVALGIFAWVSADSARANAQNCPAWQTDYSYPGISSRAYAFTEFDDGSGLALYAAGGFFSPTAPESMGLMRWDGQEWRHVASSGLGAPSGWFKDLAVFDDGSGPELYATGTFGSVGGVSARGIAKWNGTTWSALGSGLGTLSIQAGTGAALEVFDDGSGPALYVCGDFDTAGGVTSPRVARWRTNGWSAVGAGFGPLTGVGDLVVFDDGGGPALYAGGVTQFGTPYPVGVLARWNGTAWTNLISAAQSGYVFRLCTHDDGAGTALYFSGAFSQVNGVAALGLARFKNGAFSAVGDLSALGQVRSIESFPGPNGPELVVGGKFSSVGGVSAKNVASLRAGQWRSIEPAGAVNDSISISALATVGSSAAPQLVVSGDFEVLADVPSSHVAMWDGQQWSGAAGLGANTWINTLEVLDLGTGPQLYAGGSFAVIGGIASQRAARFDGQSWHPIQGVQTGTVNALERFDDGGGPRLYAASFFYGGTALLRHNGGAFQQVAALPGPGIITALQSFDDGSGDALYVGGAFTASAGLSQRYLGKWNGSNWASFNHSLDASVECFEVFDDGSGPALYMGGYFTTIDGAPRIGIARWNGAQWTDVGGGVTGYVTQLKAADLGHGPRLVAVGSFTSAGGTPTFNVASWDGASWTGFGTGAPISLRSVEAFDACAGPQLWIGGNEDWSYNSIALRRWDGSSWVAEHSENNVGAVLALRSFSTTSGRSLFVGGGFESLGGTLSSGIAEFRACAAPGVAYCFGDGGGTACACSNESTAGAGQGCVNSTGVGARLTASGSNSVQSDDQVFEISGLPPGNASMLIVGNARANQGLGLPFYDGLRCVNGMPRRFPMQIAPQTGVVTRGPGLAAQGGWLAGETRDFQAWYRDPAGPCARGSNLTNGYEIVFTP